MSAAVASSCNWVSLAKNALTYREIQRGEVANLADKDTNPKKPTSKAMTRHFVVNGMAVPVGTVTFTRK